MVMAIPIQIRFSIIINGLECHVVVDINLTMVDLDIVDLLVVMEEVIIMQRPCFKAKGDP